MDWLKRLLPVPRRDVRPSRAELDKRLENAMQRLCRAIESEEGLRKRQWLPKS